MKTNVKLFTSKMIRANGGGFSGCSGTAENYY